MLNHFDSEQFAQLMKGRKLTAREQILLKIVEKIHWRTYSLNLSNSLHQVFAARAVALGCPIFYGFANFYVLAAHPHQASLEQINRAKGRPPLPSSNVTVETELPALLTRHRAARFTFHSSRMRMQAVSEEALRAMNAQRERCVAELTDASCEAFVYGCLVALMAQGPGEHHRVIAAIGEQLRDREPLPAIVTSADALLEALQALRAQRVALVMPYMKPLARKVVDYLEAEQIEVTDWVALEEPDNAAVACIQGPRILAAARALDLTKADALVLSACVQMPSLPLIEVAETEFGLPVLSASTATAFTLLRRLELPTVLTGAGRLLQQDRRDTR